VGDEGVEIICKEHEVGRSGERSGVGEGKKNRGKVGMERRLGGEGRGRGT